MAQSVTANFRMAEQLKKSLEDICQRMGVNLAMSKLQRKLIRFIRNVRYNKLDALNAGTLLLEEHDLIEDDSANNKRRKKTRCWACGQFSNKA